MRMSRTTASMPSGDRMKVELHKVVKPSSSGRRQLHLRVPTARSSLWMFLYGITGAIAFPVHVTRPMSRMDDIVAPAEPLDGLGAGRSSGSR